MYKKKVVIRNENRKKLMSWCRDKRWNVQNQWSKVIFSPEFKICVGENNLVYVWKKA